MDKSVIRRILVTGGTGYLGNGLVKKLIDVGFYEIVLTRKKDPYYNSLSSFGEIVRFIDVDTEGWLDQLTGLEIDCIIHLATQYGRSGEPYEEVYDTNSKFPTQLLNKITNVAPDGKKIIFFNCDTKLNRETNNYSKTKKEFLDELKKNKRCTTVNMLMEHFYGTHDGKFISIVIEKMLSGVDEIDLTKGDQIRDFIYVDDVVSAFFMVLKNADNFRCDFNEFEIGSGCGYKIRKVVELIKNLTKNTKTKLNWGKVELRTDELMYSVADISKLKNLGWNPAFSLEDGLKFIIENGYS